MSRKLESIPQFCETRPFTESQVRWWVFNSNTNGLQSAVVRIGRRVYIDVTAFDQWVDAQQVAA